MAPHAEQVPTYCVANAWQEHSEIPQKQFRNANIYYGINVKQHILFFAWKKIGILESKEIYQEKLTFI